MKTAILKITCKDRKGLIANITNFLYKNQGNIINLDEFVDPISKLFFMRLEWDLTNFKLKNISKEIGKLAKKLNFKDSWELFFSNKRQRIAIFVSKYDHCLYDLLLRHKSDELKCDIPLIISNHKDLKYVADAFKIDFHYIETKDKKKREQQQLKLLKKYNIDFIVLARYMQILNKDFISKYKNKIINIHHSFLPAFEGAKAYHQAFERGVKVIGATSHFVTAKLDNGPIIQQDVTKVSHEDSVCSLIVKGRDLERKVLADAVKLFIQHRLFISRNRTIIL